VPLQIKEEKTVKTYDCRPKRRAIALALTLACAPAMADETATMLRYEYGFGSREPVHTLSLAWQTADPSGGFHVTRETSAQLPLYSSDAHRWTLMNVDGSGNDDTATGNGGDFLQAVLAVGIGAAVIASAAKSAADNIKFKIDPIKIPVPPAPTSPPAPPSGGG